MSRVNFAYQIDQQCSSKDETIKIDVSRYMIIINKALSYISQRSG